MELNQSPPPPDESDPQSAIGSGQPAPATMRLLSLVLQIHAACYVVGALAAGIAYLVRGPDTLNLGGYATARTYPATMLAVGLAAAGLLLWLARRISARPPGLYRLITITESILLADGVIGILFGIFNIWWIVGLLAASATLWYLRTDEIKRYLD